MLNKKMQMRNYIFKISASILLMISVVFAYGQSDKKHIRKGNKAYDKEDYQKAEIDYLKAIQSDDPTHKGLFNWGDVLYKQKQYLNASSVFDSVSKLNLDEETMSKVYYNLGNSLLKLAKDSAEVAQQSLTASIGSYKNSLRINPEDYEAKYNLAYAQKLLQDQQQQQQQDQQNKDQNKDQKDQQDKEDQKDKQDQNKDQEDKKDQQDQQDKKDQQDKQDQNKDQDKKQADQQQQNQSKPKQISKEDAERMLQALMNDEKNTLNKLQKEKAKVKVSKSEKDW